MNFKLRQIKGESRKIRKEWRSGSYRIVWRCICQGVRITPGYQATMRVGEQWLWVDRRGCYKTLAAAIKVCEKHAKTVIEEPKKKVRHARVRRK